MGQNTGVWAAAIVNPALPLNSARRCYWKEGWEVEQEEKQQSSSRGWENYPAV